eukprot:gene35407-42917_t
MILYVFAVLAVVWIYAAFQVLFYVDFRAHPATATENPNPYVLPIIKEEPKPSVSTSASTEQCAWPPVNPDGSIPCGSDELPYSNLKVPKFWSPPNEDFPNWTSEVDGHETIFIMIASYRDFQCRETITSALSRATYPERLFIGAVDQVVDGDTGCLDLDVPCSQDPTQWICKHLSQISVFKMDAEEATGPVTARHVGDRMYRGQHFAMQLDAHCQFVRNWDESLIAQWRSTRNEMAVLSSYLSDVQGAITAEGDSKVKTRPIMCNSDFEGAAPARYLRHGAQPEDMPAIADTPQLQPYWAAGFSFSRGHFKVRVPYDAYQPMVFQGEEIALGIRGFTYGYDYYAPVRSVIFHEYASRSARRRKVHMFWENNKHAGEGQRSIRRATAVVQLAPDLDPTTWDHSELEKYGLGTVRTTSQFYQLFLIDTHERKAVQICPFVKSGIMHRDFTAFLRPDGLGIDYSQLITYNTRKKLDEYLLSQHPVWKKNIEHGIKSMDVGFLTFGIEMAGRIGLDKADPKFVEEARQKLMEIQAEKLRKEQQQRNVPGNV